MIDQAELVNELEALAAQRAEAQAQLQRIDGAEQVVRHLIAKLHQVRDVRPAEGARDNASPVAALDRGGLARHECNGAAPAA